MGDHVVMNNMDSMSRASVSRGLGSSYSIVSRGLGTIIRPQDDEHFIIIRLLTGVPAAGSHRDDARRALFSPHHGAKQRATALNCVGCHCQGGRLLTVCGSPTSLSVPGLSNY